MHDNWTNELIDGWINEWSGLMYEWVNEWMS